MSIGCDVTPARIHVHGSHAADSLARIFCVHCAYVRQANKPSADSYCIKLLLSTCKNASTSALVCGRQRTAVQKFLDDTITILNTLVKLVHSIELFYISSFLTQSHTGIRYSNSFMRLCEKSRNVQYSYRISRS